MAIKIKDHGVWKPFTPDPLPEWAVDLMKVGGSVAFLQRAADGAEFYQFRNSGPFAKGAVVATVLLDPATGVETVKAVFRDPSMVFPLNQRLIEITGFDANDAKPHNTFAGLTYDPATRSLAAAAPEPVRAISAAQAKMALFNEKLADGTTLLDKAEDVVGSHAYRPVKIFFDGAPTWLKSDPYVRAIGLELGLISPDAQGAEVDSGFEAFFIAASKL